MTTTDWSWSQTMKAPTFPPSSTEEPSTTTNNNSMPSAQLSSFNSSWNLRPTRPSLLTNLTRTSRKRSRSDAEADSDEPDSSLPSTAKRTPSPPKQDPSSYFAMSIDPQRPSISPWAEELSEKLRDLRPDLVSRKSIRLDRSATTSLDNLHKVASVSNAIDSAHPMSSDDNDIGPGAAFIDQPPIDTATQTLGIGWTSMPTSDPTMAAAMRGYARYIETQFPLQAVSIVWQNRSMPAYLVCATTRPRVAWSHTGYVPGSPGYYLFDEELQQCRLVAKSWERAIDNLRAAGGVVFEGAEVMRSGEEVAGVEHGEVEPYYVQGMMEAGSVGLQNADGAWVMQGSGAIVAGGGDGMDVD